MKIALLAIAVLSVVVPDVVHVQGQTPPRTECSTLDDCAAGEYCSTVDGTCILNGDCTAVEDCTDNFDNIYASTMIIGTMYCIEDAGNPGKCHNIGMDTPALCSAYEYCADEDLEANCCPDEEGKFLACCAGIPNDDAASASEDAAASDPEDPAPTECSAYEACAGLDGACCPDKEGEFLACCDGIANDEEDDGRYVASCDSLKDCNTCLVASNNCVWQPVAGCLASCAVQDTSCYAIQYFGNETIEAICDIAETDNGSGGDGGMDEAIDPDFGVEPPVDPDFGVAPPVDPDFSVEPPVDPDFGVEPPIDPDFSVEPPVDPDFGVAPPIDPDFGVDPPQGCESDTDCESDKEYCGQGTCILKGMCIVDEDCMNTANDQYADKKCRGYKFCNEFKECDRMCGEPCPGGTGAEETECTVTGCDTKILCPNSVSCTPDYCQDCKGMYFDPMGMVIEGCGVTITDDGADAPTSADAPQDGSTSVSSPPTSATENDEEKEEKQNDKKDDEEKEEKQNDKKDDEEKEEKQNDKKNDEEKEEKGDAAAAAATTTMTTDETTVIEPTGTTASADTTSADPSSTGEVIGEGTTYVSGSVSIVGLGRTVGSVAIVVLVTITAVLSL